VETSFGSRASSSRWKRRPRDSEGATPVGRLRRRRGVGVAANFIFVTMGWRVTQALVRTIVLHGWLGRFVGVLRSPPARLEPPDAQKSAGARTNELSGGFYLSQTLAENASNDSTDPSEASKRGARSGTSCDGGVEAARHRGPLD